MRRFAIAAFLVVVSLTPAHGQAADAIRALRRQSNAAIARHDVNGVMAVLDTGYQITTGSGEFATGRTAERAAWIAEFASAADRVYRRTPSSIEVSDSGTRAAEVGEWTGSWTTGKGVTKTGGRYAAYWRLVGKTWRLRSELFVSLRCEGAGCS